MTNATRLRVAGLVVVAMLLCGESYGQTATIDFRVSGAKADCAGVPVHAIVDLPADFANVPLKNVCVTMKQPGADPAPFSGQLVACGQGKTELWWILPQAQAGRDSRWSAQLRVKGPPGGAVFAWKDSPGKHLDLLFGDRPVLRYMYAFDATTSETLHETYKPYYHVFDAAGQKLLTKGSGGLYTHHRGIFIGWNKLKQGDNEHDFWHMKGVTQRHQKVLEQSAGPVLARLKTLIHWDDPDGKPVIVEEREVTVFRQAAPAILLLEFHTKLKAAAGDVFFNGDPEHAGFQYRPHNDVADGDESVKAKYKFHQDGIDAHKDRDLPWAAMSYGLNGRRYSVLHMNHPDNPKATLYSAYRDYGRFGAFPTKKLEAGETLPLCYRILVVEGPLPARDELAAKHATFVDAPRVSTD